MALGFRSSVNRSWGVNGTSRDRVSLSFRRSSVNRNSGVNKSSGARASMGAREIRRQQDLERSTVLRLALKGSTFFNQTPEH